MSALIAVLAGVSVTTLIVGLFRPTGAAAVRRRAERLLLPEPTVSADDPFATRVLGPILEAILRSTSARLPMTLVSSVGSRLHTAGMSVSATHFVARWLSIGVLPAVAFGAFLVVTGSTGRMNLMLLGAWLAAGGYGPWRWLGRRAESRTKAIDKELPDAIDMIVTSIEAGLGIQQAMMTVAEKFSGALAEEFSLVVAETRVGRTRAEAMAEMAARAGSRDLMLFVRAINQAEEMGIAIGEVLRNQASEIRDRRHQHAREEAAKIPVKMTIPTILLMLPTMFILILTPVILNAMASF